MCLVFKLADIFFKAELKQFYCNTSWRHFICIVDSASKRKRETNRGNLRSCLCVLLSLHHIQPSWWKWALPAVERRASVVCVHVWQHGGLCQPRSLFHQRAHTQPYIVMHEYLELCMCDHVSYKSKCFAPIESKPEWLRRKTDATLLLKHLQVLV